MALANTITLDSGTGCKNPFTGTLPANLQEHINNETLTLAIISSLFITTPAVMVYSSSVWKAASLVSGVQPHQYLPEPGDPDPTFVLGDVIYRG